MTNTNTNLVEAKKVFDALIAKIKTEYGTLPGDFPLRTFLVIDTFGGFLHNGDELKKLGIVRADEASHAFCAATFAIQGAHEMLGIFLSRLESDEEDDDEDEDEIGVSFSSLDEAEESLEALLENNGMCNNIVFEVTKEYHASQLMFLVQHYSDNPFKTSVVVGGQVVQFSGTLRDLDLNYAGAVIGNRCLIERSVMHRLSS